MTSMLRTLFLLGLSGAALCANAQKRTDTVFLLRQSVKEMGRMLHGSVFIDPSKNSRHYKWISDFRVDSDPAFFQQSLQYLSDRKIKLAKLPLTTVPRRWVPVHLYKNKYYLYRPCDSYGYYRVFITDTAFVDDYGEGFSANKIHLFKNVAGKRFEFSLTGIEKQNRKLIMHMVNGQNGIAVFEDVHDGSTKTYYLMIDADRIKQFQVVVNYCPESKADEFEFDTPDFQKLINGK